MFFAILGLAVAIYSIILGQQIKKTPDYKPACDISDRVSCSKALKSSYASMFGVSNAFIGVIYYAFVIILQLVSWYGLLLLLTSIGALFSIYLTFILYTRIRSFCVLCTFAYIINFILLYLSYMRYMG